jgi:hypothetical protein
MDRRSRFFAGAALVCVVLIPVSDASLRWVPIIVSIAYAVLAVLSFLDWRSRVR